MEVDTLIRVLIADDNAIVREGLAAIIGRQRDLEVVGQAQNGEEAIALFRFHQPDVTLMDIRMPLKDGIEATKSICHEFPQARILILTTFADQEQLDLASRAGAGGYVLKDAPREELLRAIRSLIEHQNPYGETSRNS